MHWVGDKSFDQFVSRQDDWKILFGVADGLSFVRGITGMHMEG